MHDCSFDVSCSGLSIVLGFGLALKVQVLMNAVAQGPEQLVKVFNRRLDYGLWYKIPPTFVFSYDTEGLCIIAWDSAVGVMGAAAEFGIRS